MASVRGSLTVKTAAGWAWLPSCRSENSSLLARCSAPQVWMVLELRGTVSAAQWGLTFRGQQRLAGANMGPAPGRRGGPWGPRSLRECAQRIGWGQGLLLCPTEPAGSWVSAFRQSAAWEAEGQPVGKEFGAGQMPMGRRNQRPLCAVDPSSLWGRRPTAPVHTDTATRCQGLGKAD